MLAGYVVTTAVIAGLALAGFLFCRRARPATALDAFVTAAVPVIVFLVSMTAVMKILRQPFITWSHNRLAPAVALLHGYGCGGGQDNGAVLSWMYGPLAAIAYLPAAVFSSPTAALLAAGMISIIFFCLPLAMAARLGAGTKAGAGRTAEAIASFFALFFLCAALPALAGSQFNIHADAPSLGLAGAACIALVNGVKKNSRASWAASALLLPCAIFTKQNTLPLLLALPLYVLAARGAGTALRYCAGIAAATLFLAAVSWLTCGAAGGFLAAFKQPLAYPWVALSPGIYTESPLIAGPALAVRMKTLGIAAAELAVLSLPFIAVILLDGKLSAPGRKSNVSVFTRFPAWLKEKEWSLLVLAGVCSSPVALLSRVKLGGYFNSYAITLYFLALAGAMVLSKILTAENKPAPAPRLIQPGIRITIMLWVVAVSFMTIKNVAPHLVILASGLKDNPVEQAYRFARMHQGQAFFPHFPLSTLMAEGKLYHSAYGLWDREMAGQHIDTSRFKTCIPQNMLYACFHKDSRFDKSDVAERLLREMGFNTEVHIAGMEDWIIFTKNIFGEAP